MWQNIIMDSLFKNAFEWGLLAYKLDHTQQQIPSMTGTGYHHNNTQKKLLKGTACIQCLHSSMFNVCIFLKPHTEHAGSTPLAAAASLSPRETRRINPAARPSCGAGLRGGGCAPPRSLPSRTPSSSAVATPAHANRRVLIFSPNL